MTNAEIGDVVTKVLRSRLSHYGFAQAQVESELDFDGTPIIRVTARYENGHVPSNRLSETLGNIRSELVKKGENRFVFLDSRYPDDEEIDEDTE